MYYEISVGIDVLKWLEEEGLVPGVGVSESSKAVRIWTNKILDVDKVFNERLYQRMPDIDKKRYLTEEDYKVIGGLMDEVEREYGEVINGEVRRLNQLITEAVVLPVFNNEEIVLQVFYWFNEEAVIPYDNGVLIGIDMPFVYYKKPDPRNRYKDYPWLYISNSEGTVTITSTLDKAMTAWEILKKLKGSRIRDYMEITTKRIDETAYCDCDCDCGG